MFTEEAAFDLDLVARIGREAGKGNFGQRKQKHR
jgi:hypothetical protein